jgi:hypothetical protein
VTSAPEIAMPDIDPLAFGIRFALTQETIGREARKLIPSLTDHQLEHLCMQVAKHLRLSAGSSDRRIRRRQPISSHLGKRRKRAAIRHRRREAKGLRDRCRVREASAV